MLWNTKKMVKARKRKGLTQIELGEIMGKHEITIFNWENGISEPDIANKRMLREVLGVELS